MFPVSGPIIVFLDLSSVPPRTACQTRINHMTIEAETAQAGMVKLRRKRVEVDRSEDLPQEGEVQSPSFVF
jgi:hypothetical protein